MSDVERPLLPSVTMVFAAVDGGINLVRKREQVAKVVHRVVTRLMQVGAAGRTWQLLAHRLTCMSMSCCCLCIQYIRTSRLVQPAECVIPHHWHPPTCCAVGNSVCRFFRPCCWRCLMATCAGSKMECSSTCWPSGRRHGQQSGAY